MIIPGRAAEARLAIASWSSVNLRIGSELFLLYTLLSAPDGQASAKRQPDLVATHKPGSPWPVVACKQRLALRGNVSFV